MNALKLLNRHRSLFSEDYGKYEEELSDKLRKSNVLVIGGGGYIGRGVVEVLCRYDCQIDVVDISENNLAELVRKIRSNSRITGANINTYAIDCGSDLLKRLVRNRGSYDYAFNLSALKHVRSEADVFTFMRMIETNVLNVVENMKCLQSDRLKSYLAVSTDKAANPHNMMGATKRIMEIF